GRATSRRRNREQSGSAAESERTVPNVHLTARTRSPGWFRRDRGPWTRARTRSEAAAHQLVQRHGAEQEAHVGDRPAEEAHGPGVGGVPEQPVRLVGEDRAE